MGKKSSRKNKRKQEKSKVKDKAKDKVKAGAKVNTFTGMEQRFLELEKRLDEAVSDNLRFPSRLELSEWSRLSKIKFKIPRVDIIDRDDDIMVRADVPGVSTQDLDVSFTDNTITIRGSTGEEKKEEKGDYFRSETIKGSFTRTMYLPSDVDGSQAVSTFEGGVLEVVVPKLEKAKRIKVSLA